MLAKLYICGHSNLLLYRRLVTLKDDLEISEILHYSNSARVRISPSNNSRGYYFSSSDSSSSTNSGGSSSSSSSSNCGGGGGTGTKSGDRELESNLSQERDDGDIVVHSNYFRYIGEEVHAVEYLKSIHPSLLRPLQLLREQYHNLERRI